MYHVQRLLMLLALAQSPGPPLPPSPCSWNLGKASPKTGVAVETLRPSSSSCASHMHTYTHGHTHTQTCITKLLSRQLGPRSNSSTRKHQLSSLVQDHLPSLKERIQETELCEQIKGPNCRSSHFSGTRFRRFKALALKQRFQPPSAIVPPPMVAVIPETSAKALLSSSFRCVETQRLERLDGSVWTTTDFPGKRPEMDVGFGPRPDKCYSKLVKVKFATRNSSGPLQYGMLVRFVVLPACCIPGYIRPCPVKKEKKVVFLLL